MDITWEMVEPHLPEKASLYYVDRNESLENRLQEIQTCIQEQSYEALDIIYDYWEPDYEFDKKESQTFLLSKFTNVEVEWIMSTFETEIEEHLHEVDTSTLFDDLARNTPELIFIYDTSYELEEDSWRWDRKRIASEVKKIMRHLGIKVKDCNENNNVWKVLWDCVQNATYGGKVEIFFSCKFGKLMDIDPSINTIQFENFTIGIINHDNGSGYQDNTVGVTIELPFVKENVFVEKNIRYNWTWDIAGVSENAYDATKVTFTKSKSKRIIEASKLNEHIKKEAELNKIFKSGSCTTGDMNIKRHRNTHYINEFPCGTRCEDCLTFWID